MLHLRQNVKRVYTFITHEQISPSGKQSKIFHVSGSDMPCEVWVLVGSVRAVRTLKRPHPRVCPHVSLQVPRPSKDLPAQGTLVAPGAPGVGRGQSEGWPGAPRDHLSTPVYTHDWQLSLLPLQHTNLLSVLDAFHFQQSINQTALPHLLNKTNIYFHIYIYVNSPNMPLTNYHFNINIPSTFCPPV